MPLSTLLSDRELVAQPDAAPVRFLIWWRSSGHRYLDDLQAQNANLPALRRVWLTMSCRREAAAPRVDALADTVVAADPLLVMFTRWQWPARARA